MPPTLETWPDCLRVPHGSTVTRVVEVTDHFFLHKKEPLPNIFVVTDRDRDEGTRRGMQPLVSVWEHPVTEQRIKEIRGLDPQIECRSFRITAGQVAAFESLDPSIPLVVAYDPLHHLHEGRHHCGIQGLERPKSVARLAHKTLIQKLIETCTEI